MTDKVRIAIIELSCINHEVVNLCQFASQGKNEVTLITTDDLLINLQSELDPLDIQLKIISKEKHESYLFFILRCNNIINCNFDLVIINSIRRWEFIFFHPVSKIICYLYSLNFWFKDTKTTRNGLKKNLLNRLNLLTFLPGRFHANPIFGSIIRRRILNQIDGVLVEYPPFVDLVQRDYKYLKQVHFLPKRYFEGVSNNMEKTKTTFTITGTISDNRRDYYTVLDAINHIPEQLKSMLRLVLLGRPIGKYGDMIIERCKSMIADGWDIDYSDEYIPQDIMTQKLQATDVMIAPMKFTYTSGTINERFTYTKGTGTFNDAIRFGTPAIVPVDYNIAAEFASCFLTYSDQHSLSEILSELIENPDKLLNVKEATINVMKNFTLPIVQEMFRNIVVDFLDK